MKTVLLQITEGQNECGDICLKYMVQRGDLFYWPLEDDESCESCSVIVHEVPQPIPKPSKSTSRRTFYDVPGAGVCLSD